MLTVLDIIQESVDAENQEQQATGYFRPQDYLIGLYDNHGPVDFNGNKDIDERYRQSDYQQVSDNSQEPPKYGLTSP